MRKIEVGVAQTDLARVVEDVAAGEEIVLANAGKPVARLISFEPRQPGLMRRKTWIADNFDDPPPEEIMAAFRGERP